MLESRTVSCGCDGQLRQDFPLRFGCRAVIVSPLSFAIRPAWFAHFDWSIPLAVVVAAGDKAVKIIIATARFRGRTSIPVTAENRRLRRACGPNQQSQIFDATSRKGRQQSRNHSITPSSFGRSRKTRPRYSIDSGPGLERKREFRSVDRFAWGNWICTI